MSFFVDANVVVYAAGSSPYREPCLAILEAVADGTVEGRSSTAALEEIWHLELSGRAGPLDGLVEETYRLFAPLLAVTDEAFRRALAIAAPGVGANDRLHAGTCLAHGIDTIVSADEDFDAIGEVSRVDPMDALAVARLLTHER